MNVVGLPLIVVCLNSFCEPDTNVGLLEKLYSPALALQKYCELTWSSSSLNLSCEPLGCKQFINLSAVFLFEFTDEPIPKPLWEPVLNRTISSASTFFPGIEADNYC